MLLGRVEVECSGAGAEGARHARAREGLTGQGDFEVGESGRRVGEGGSGPQVE